MKETEIYEKNKQTFFFDCIRIRCALNKHDWNGIICVDTNEKYSSALKRASKEIRETLVIVGVCMCVRVRGRKKKEITQKTQITKQ